MSRRGIEVSSGQGIYTERDMVARGEVVIAGENAGATVIQAGSDPEGDVFRAGAMSRT